MWEVNTFTRWGKGELEVPLILIEDQDLYSQVPKVF